MPESEDEKKHEDNVVESKVEVRLENAVDQAGLLIRKDEAANIEMPKTPTIPRLFVDDNDRVTVEIDILYEPETGRVLQVIRKGLIATELAGESFRLARASYFAEFSAISYDQLTTYRRNSSILDPESKRLVVDKRQLKNIVLVNHLKRWNMPGRDGQTIELEFRPSGSLSVLSATNVFKAIPALLDVIMLILENKLLTSFDGFDG